MKSILTNEFDSIGQGYIARMRYQTIVIMTCTTITLYKPATIVRVLLNKIYIVHDEYYSVQ